VVDVEEESVAADERDPGAGVGVGVTAAQDDAAVGAGLDDEVGQVLGEDVVAGVAAVAVGVELRLAELVAVVPGHRGAPLDLEMPAPRARCPPRVGPPDPCRGSGDPRRRGGIGNPRSRYVNETYPLSIRYETLLGWLATWRCGNTHRSHPRPMAGGVGPAGVRRLWVLRCCCPWSDSAHLFPWWDPTSPTCRDAPCWVPWWC
jgi:hypothetical protein